MAIKDRSAIEALLKKHWMYKGTVYFISDFIEAGDDIIFSTDIKAIRIGLAAIPEFVKLCLPADTTPAKHNGNGHHEVVSIGGIEPGVFSELTTGLMTSFREIQGSKDEAFLKQADKRAKAKIGITRAITDIAKTAIAGKKAMGNNK